MTPDELLQSLSRPTSGVVETLAAIDGDLVVLGAGGKMGPTLARMAQRARTEAESAHQVIAVARFTDPTARAELEAHGVRTIKCDLLDRRAVAQLPDAAAIMFMAGTKFGTSSTASSTWALNALVPGITAERYTGVPTVVFSSGNVYPFMPIDGPTANESTPPAPIGEYAWSVLCRERIFEHFASRERTPTLIYRLNYAAELRYGVPVDIARKVFTGSEIDVSMGHFNVIWQGDANAIALQSLRLATNPARILNVTGAETVSVRDLACQFGRHFAVEPILIGTEQPTALLSDASAALDLFGPPTVSLVQLIELIADWVKNGGEMFAKPTHYEVRNGVF